MEIPVSDLDIGMEGERGLVAGRSQREKRRSYKDLLREEEEIAAQVRKSSKKRPKVNLCFTFTELITYLMNGRVQFLTFMFCVISH